MGIKRKFESTDNMYKYNIFCMNAAIAKVWLVI